MANLKQGINKITHITETVRHQVETLAAACRQVEPIAMSLYLEESPVGSDDTNQFAFWQDDELVGFVVLFGNDPIEIIGMVRPEYRRKGIGRALLQTAIAEGERRGETQALLICEGSSSSGQAFVEAVGGTYRFAEYRMVLDRDRFARSQRGEETVILQQATIDDLEQLVALRIAAIEGQSEQGIRQYTQTYLQRADQRFFIGLLDGKPIGTLRVDEDGTTAGIYAFVVLPELRGRGYGRQILLQTLDRLVAEDWETIMLEVETQNRNALRLYERCGFQETTTYHYYHLAI